jgi:asparagine synthase (glutamine-hydrolysing)
MCGICGEIRFDGRPASARAVERMAEVLAPRGPDGQGAYARGPIAFGHRRLSIIDRSARGGQPMIDSELGLACVFNGCIYNYPELRHELIAAGQRFFSTSDTEVLMKAYAAWGPSFVERLNGMFAFAIWERDSGRTLLGRDRLGIKPLYFHEARGVLRFASSLPALVASGDVSSDVDPVALHHYLSFHSVVPAPHTILREVKKLPPATLLTLEPDGSRREHRFWEVRYAPLALDEPTWKARLLEVLRRSVKRRLVADVEVGVLLSGGLDSSLVVGLLAEAGQRGLTTFSVGFEDAGGEKGNEFAYSDIVAERYGTNHHRFLVPTRAMLPALHDCVKAMSEPMVSHDVIGFYLLSQQVKKHLSVVQSGQGADEIFAGYHWYPPMLTPGDDAVEAYAKVFFDRDHDEMRRVVEPHWLGDDHSRAFVRAHFDRPGADRAIDKALRLDSTVMLVDDPVKRVDNTTMAWGLEARVPFLDHEVVELAAQIPAELKVHQGGKHILKEAAREVIPHEVIDRPKGYFPVPALKYIQGPALDLVRDILEVPVARARGLVRRDYVDELLAAPTAHITPLQGSKLWQVALLEYWFQVQGL